MASNAVRTDVWPSPLSFDYTVTAICRVTTACTMHRGMMSTLCMFEIRYIFPFTPCSLTGIFLFDDKAGRDTRNYKTGELVV